MMQQDLARPVAPLVHQQGRMASSGPLARLYEGGFILMPAIVVIALIASFYASPSLELKLILWISFAICALSLDFVWGRAGIFSFGQNALFGIGGYAYAVIALNVFPDSGETITALLGAAVAGGVGAAMLGYFMFYGRLSDVYLSIVTLAVTLILYTVLASTAGPEYHIGEALLGGFNGIPSLPGIAFPGLFGHDGGELSLHQLLVFAILMAGLIYFGLNQLVRSRFGLVLDGLRSNELRMELLGYDIRKTKLMAFVLGGLVAGAGGGLFAAWGTFINPSVFSLAQAATVVVWVMVGGRGSLVGAFVGVLLVQVASDSAELVVSQQTPLIVGLLLLLAVWLMPEGIVPTLAKLIGRTGGRHWSVDAGAAQGTSQGIAPAAHKGQRGKLQVKDLAKSFGGASVLRGLSAEFGDRPIQAIIGPNGAGKSTLFNVLTGRHALDRGQVFLNGKDIRPLPTFRRCRLGLGIKMQIPCIFQDLTVAQNIVLARMASRRSFRQVDVLHLVGLQGRDDEVANTLAHGEQQWLEMAMLLAQDPSVVLLDEPGAGMGSDDKLRTLELIHRLAEDHTIVVVEHDMEFIRRLEAPVFVLHKGVVFKSGTFAEMLADEEVIDVYLGRKSHAAG